MEQVVRLIRSKGVGIYFCSQNPDDAPDTVLGQLGIASSTRCAPTHRATRKPCAPLPKPFRQCKVDVVATISQLGVGEALVSTLQENGVPMPVEQTLIAPPTCRIGAITEEERHAMAMRSPIGWGIRHAN